MDPCEGCGAKVKIAGGIDNLWEFEGDVSKGMTLELVDGTEFFLCFDCINKLPDYPTERDVSELSDPVN